MRRSSRAPVLAWLLVMMTISATAPGEPVSVPDPGPRDTCPVCGMFVGKYPEWTATVLYKDGHAHHFDGAKDLFKYLLDLSRWAPGHDAVDIAAVAATDYYSLERIAARDAWYVVGSDVLGPMGHELIPLRTREDAEAFMDDHAGRRIIRFDEVTLELLADLDEGRFGLPGG
mgnify:CR=1 FL=1